MNFPHSPVRDGLAQLDEGIFRRITANRQPRGARVRTAGLFDGWRVVLKVAPASCRQWGARPALVAGETPAGQPPGRRRY